MSHEEDTKARPEPVKADRKPYHPPQIESEKVIEKQLMAICYTIDEGCDQDPPQT